MSSRCRFRGSLVATLVEDRRFRGSSGVAPAEARGAWRFRASFGVTPVEDRGFRSSGCRFRGSFGMTLVEERSFRLPGCLPGVASELHLE